MAQNDGGPAGDHIMLMAAGNIVLDPGNCAGVGNPYYTPTSSGQYDAIGRTGVGDYGNVYIPGSSLIIGSTTKTTNPRTYSLEVNGNFNCTGLYVNGTAFTASTQLWSATYAVGGSSSFVPNSGEVFKVSGKSTFTNTVTVDTGGLTVSAGGLTVTAGGLTVTAGGLTVTAGGITAAAGDIVASGGNVKGTSVYSTSDYRIKENVKLLDDFFTVDVLRPVHYYNTKSEKEDIGFIAHEVGEYYPFMVTGEKDGKEYQALNYSAIIPILVKEAKVSKEEAKTLKEETKTLKEEAKTLKEEAKTLKEETKTLKEEIIRLKSTQDTATEEIHHLTSLVEAQSKQMADLQEANANILKEMQRIIRMIPNPILH
jgi:polyhydroxyalkanoate synthesis regulator phasin